MAQITPAIIVPAFSRPKSLKRLLASLQTAKYPSDNTQLVLTLDGGASDEVVAVADDFSFHHGQVEVIHRQKNIGLKKHIIWCGDQSEKYGSVIVLEDDLSVDVHFYTYAVEALQYFLKESKIAGIALYAQKLNEYAALPFEPISDLSTGYFMQVPCSWGQVWSVTQWRGFKAWYNHANKTLIEQNLRVPAMVKNWPETSWKKYFATYLIASQKYFFYPFISYSTNCSDMGGAHIKKGTNSHEVPLPLPCRRQEAFNFCSFQNSVIHYDSFMEPIALHGFKWPQISNSDIEIDFYGIKPLELLKEKKYVITSKKCSDIIAMFRLGSRPIERSLTEELPQKKSARQKNNCICLIESKFLNNEQQPYLKLLKYYSYLPLTTKSFFERLMPPWIIKFIVRISKSGFVNHSILKNK